MPPMIPLPRNRKAAVNRDRRPLPVPVERSVDFCRVFIDGVNQPGTYQFSTAMRQVHDMDNAYVWLSLKEPSVESVSYTHL